MWIDQADDPLKLFEEWYELAHEATDFEPKKVALATVDETGMPDCRIVLLKSYKPGQWGFFTNYDSTKAHELDQQKKAALTFHWEKPFHRQVRLRGEVVRMSHEESEEYHKSRPRGSQVGAWASPQSQAITSREELMDRVLEIESKFKDEEVPLPPHWGGYWLRPLSIEFWQAQDFRLHDRLMFERKDLNSPWLSRRLAP